MRRKRIIRALFSIVFLLLPLESFAQSSLAEIIPRIKKELVKIQSRERPNRQDQSSDPYFYFFRVPIAQGRDTFPIATGFVLTDGQHVATSARALAGLERLEIVSDERKTFPARVVGIDSTLDLAILKIEAKAKAFSGIDFGDSSLARLGDSYYLFGRSVRLTFQKAHLSSTDQVDGAFGRHWLIDVPTSPAVSGGPLVDSRGRVVGMAVSNPSGPEHFGTVLPSSLIRKATADLLKFGKPKRAWFGIIPRVQANIDQLDHIRSADVKGGILIENLIVDGPSAEAGLQINDLIMSIDGTSLRSIEDIYAFAEKKKAHETVNIKVFRGNKGVFELKLKLGELPNARDLPNAENLL